MALHLNADEHDANPPSSWKVVKATDRRWQLQDKNGGVLDTFATKREADAAKVSGYLVDLYNKEGRWFAGENVPGWKRYVPAVAAAQ